MAIAIQPPSIGNFSLSSSQQPGPFFAFGQNIIDKNQLTVSYTPDYLYSKTQSILEGTSSLLYGITDSFSVLLTLPIALKYATGKKTLSGMGDLVLDLEYAFYSKENAHYSDQATIIFSPTFPTSNLDEISKKLDPTSRTSGFSRVNAPSSFNAMTYFIGSTYSRTLVDWYGFVAPGVLFIDKHDSIEQGTQYYYNLGIGRNIKAVEKKYIFLGLLEINGQYSARTKLGSYVVPNTGGTIIYATPSLWFSTPKMIFQLGISLPITQRWYGNQSKVSYYSGAIITWTIH
ncbi:hypothetical protein [Legionella rowbothamii]|uniref:hypothetical protein n=1 Tax=Legionella rowbothamii TaxID=96229 RepID=UPI001F5E8B2D|nr:hypothetical protein [Legionella rowbothamii]